MNRVFMFRTGRLSIPGMVAIPEDKIVSVQVHDCDLNTFIVNGIIVQGDFQAFIDMLGTPTTVPQIDRG